jgi:hypothetical protein
MNVAPPFVPILSQPYNARAILGSILSACRETCRASIRVYLLEIFAGQVVYFCP